MTINNNSDKDNLSDFEQLVQDDIRSQVTDTERSILLDENPEEWYGILISIIRRIDVQLSNAKAERARIRKDYDELVTKKLEWRASALGFRVLAEKRLAEAKGILNRQEEPIEIIKLQAAIRTHRKAVESDLPSVEAELVDQALWSTVNR